MGIGAAGADRVIASVPTPVAVDARAAELVLLVAGLAFTLVIVAVFGTIIWRAVIAERRADAERARARAQHDASPTDDREEE